MDSNSRCPRIDDRQLYRYTVEMLVTPQQLDRIRVLLRESLCGGDDDHEGPCRIAWSGSITDREDLLADVDDPTEIEYIEQDLRKIEVLPREDVDGALGI